MILANFGLQYRIQLTVSHLRYLLNDTLLADGVRKNSFAKIFLRDFRLLNQIHQLLIDEQ